MREWRNEAGKSKMRIGVLALQGAVREHIKLIEQLGHEGLAIKKLEQLNDIDGLIIPGGESTAIGKLMIKYGLDVAIKEFSQQKKPIFGTCAGLIILANKINGMDECYLEIMDIAVERNAFGRQKESFEVDIKVKGIAEDFRAVFIRAPYIIEVGDDVNILAEYDNKIVAARQGHLICSAFHPELTEDTRIHEYFIDMVHEYVYNN